jgi:hypothetical protein
MNFICRRFGTLGLSHIHRRCKQEVFLLTRLMKIEQCSETSAYTIQTLGNHPKGRIQHWEHGESLKSTLDVCSRMKLDEIKEKHLPQLCGPIQHYKGIFSSCHSACPTQKKHDNVLLHLFCVSSGIAQFRRHRVKRNFLLTHTGENALSTFSTRDPVPPFDENNFRYSMHKCNSKQHAVLRWNLCVLSDMATDSFSNFS